MRMQRDRRHCRKKLQLAGLKIFNDFALMIGDHQIYHDLACLLVNGDLGRIRLAPAGNGQQ